MLVVPAMRLIVRLVEVCKFQQSSLHICLYCSSYQNHRQHQQLLARLPTRVSISVQSTVSKIKWRRSCIGLQCAAGIVCPAYQAFGDGIIDASDVNVNAVASLVCKKDFEISGTGATSRCQGNGTWSKPMASCERKEDLSNSGFF